MPSGKTQDSNARAGNLRLNYFASSLADVASHMRTVLRLSSRSHRSRGMKNPHDAYVSGYNDALEECAQIVEQTVLGSDE